MNPNVKEATELLKAMKDIVGAVTHWAAPSIIRTLFLISSVALVILGASYFYVDGLLESSKETTNLQSQQLRISTDQLQLRYAYNLVTECIDSTKEKEPLAAFYCEKAEDAYLAYFTIEPDRTQAILSTQQDAYRAMRADLLRRIEDKENELRRLAWSDPAAKILDQILRTNVLLLFIASTICVIFLLYAFVLRARRNVPTVPKQPEA